MSRGMRIGIDGTAKKITTMYVGVNGISKRVKKAYIGIGGVARPFFGEYEMAYYGPITSLQYNASTLMGTEIGDYAVFTGFGLSSSEGTYSNLMELYNNSLTKSNTTMSKVRKSMCAATTGQYTVIAGGQGNERKKLTLVEAYNPSLTRTIAEDLNTNRSHAGATSVGDYALIVNGSTSVNSTGGVDGTNVVEAYSSSLTHVIPAASIYDGTLCAYVGNYALIKAAQNAMIETYDSSLTKQNQLTSENKMMECAAVSLGGKYAIFAGGKISSSATTTIVNAFNSSLTRSTLDPLTDASLSIAATSKGRYAIFSGGSGSSSYSKTVELYDDSLTHTVTTGLTTGRILHAPARTKNYVLFGGGFGYTNESTGKTGYLNTVEAYSYV